MMTEEQLIDRICLTCVDVRHATTDESAQKFINDIRGLAEQLAALTQPAIPALKLPEELPPRFYPVIMGGKTAMLPADDGEWLNITTVVEYIDEVKRLNAPHTAPIEPICATGGAEWVSIEDEPPRDGSWCIAIEEGDFAGDIVYWVNGVWKSEFGRDEYTHWMYHPAAPET